MHESETRTTETMASSDSPWVTATPQQRPRPATIHEGFSFCSFSDDLTSFQPWESPSFSLQQTPSECPSRPVSMHRDICSPEALDTINRWSQKSLYEDHSESHFDSDVAMNQGYGHDDTIPMLNLKCSDQPQDADHVRFDGFLDPRRMSGSSFTMSTSGGLSDMPPYDDFSAALSEAPSFGSECPPPSNRNSLMSSTHLSPVASPRLTPQGRSDLVRTQSRGRASPSPRPSVRSTPYNLETARNKRWSTGSYAPLSNRRPAPFIFQAGQDVVASHQRMAGHTSSPNLGTGLSSMGINGYHPMSQPQFMMACPPPTQRSSMLLPSQLPSQVPSHMSNQLFAPENGHFDRQPSLLSHGIFRMLQSNAAPHSLHGNYADMSDPPDLFASLHEEQLEPPPEDMNPSDPDMVPHEQELRFEGDLYTPKWVRGHGNKREGWCGICKPGRWLVLKNSAFWYDKSFSHGISAATGSSFREPQGTRRMDGNPDVWEGLCGSCDEWIALVSNKKKGTTWFRHAYKCHTHPKIKDGPKRRRESSNTKSLITASGIRPRTDNLQPQISPMTPLPSTLGASTGHMHDQQGTPVPPPPPVRSVSIDPSKLMASHEAYPNMI